MIAEAAATHQLVPYVQQAVETGTTHQRDVYTPTEILSGLAAMMMGVRYEREPPIRSALTLPEHATYEEVLFARLGNAFLKPDTSRATNFELSNRSANPGACIAAEITFAALLRAKTERVDDIAVGPTLIYDDPDGNPLLLQKTYGAITALGLVPVTVQGVEYPSGTIFAAYSEPATLLRDNKLGFKIGVDVPIEQHVSASVIDSLAPLKMSLFGIPSGERVSVANDFNLYNLRQSAQTVSELIDTADGASLADFRDAFRQ